MFLCHFEICSSQGIVTKTSQNMPNDFSVMVEPIGQLLIERKVGLNRPLSGRKNESMCLVASCQFKHSGHFCKDTKHNRFASL